MCYVFSESFLAHGTSPCCGTSRRGNITHVPKHNTLRKGSQVIHCDGIDSRVSTAGRRTGGATGPVPGGAPPTGTWPMAIISIHGELEGGEAGATITAGAVDGEAGPQWQLVQGQDNLHPL